MGWSVGGEAIAALHDQEYSAGYTGRGVRRLLRRYQLVNPPSHPLTNSFPDAGIIHEGTRELTGGAGVAGTGGAAAGGARPAVVRADQPPPDPSLARRAPSAADAAWVG